MSTSTEGPLLSRSGAIVVAVIGVISAVAGVIVGLVPMSSCGAFFAPSGSGLSLDSIFADEFCKRDFEGRGWWVWGLIIIGVALLIFGLIRALREEAVPPVTLSQRLSEREADASPAVTMASEIAQLADLHERGLLSDDEFTAAKERALGQRR